MERAGYLINKLREQYFQQQSATNLLITLDLLRKELFAQLSPDPAEVQAVSAPMPAPLTVSGRPSDDALYALDFSKDLPTFAHQNLACPAEAEAAAMRKKMLSAEALSHSGSVAETNVSQHTANQEPIRDLKKAIQASDRYVFINELFRGDESMYERSIKTIQAFSIFPEAQFWIERELKTKLGWQDADPNFQYFAQLVKRRFS
ncbi:MAG: hypothetical protein FGM61_01630 [Sediminibacterium sp.]|nr:hypothetical protein [Sediminibacterium sp.]